MFLNVKLFDKTSFYEVTPEQSLVSLKEEISRRNGVEYNSLRLVYNTRSLNDNDLIGMHNLQNLSMVQAFVTCLGGGNQLAENDREIAEKRNKKKICRRCNKKQALKATNCRGKTCGSKDLRLKKALKVVKK
ncbi:ubiquitin L40 ribosomal protein [Nosema bombycis CQ1]|uniref:Ubiquitin L40 ribosomal protein n=2 Tax=Nosema bombycis TaxID=27978 RepID=R0MGH8_NOSB1|nr:60S ribosomal protein L40 [Nosema bombycis]EOB13235.1 ubiquitin L40 ribosomal protein [Nosema bombycis CQ1]|eukprot:EOB13235.1 ubiquitin L40 ribosomal protein [Nosema bombycis CQ1]